LELFSLVTVLAPIAHYPWEPTVRFWFLIPPVLLALSGLPVHRSTFAVTPTPPHRSTPPSVQMLATASLQVPVTSLLVSTLVRQLALDFATPSLAVPQVMSLQREATTPPWARTLWVL
jgi:hypothetical protein